jgi:hypothetical protein
MEKNKTILIFMPDFFEYQAQIKTAFQEEGWITRVYTDRPKSSWFQKGIIRLNRKLAALKTTHYLKTIAQKNKDYNPDLVLIIDGQAFTKKHLSFLKKAFPEASFVLYLWDGLKNLPYTKKLFPYFDKCYTFDENDAAHEKSLNFLSLFYLPEMVNESQNYPQSDCVAFVGTAHPGKFGRIRSFLEAAKKANLETSFYIYLQSKFLVFLYSLFSKDFRGVSPRIFSYKKIKYSQVKSIYGKGKFIFDSPRNNQTGLTMRTFECMALHKKLITTNEAIKHYDFYDPQNIYIYTGGDLDLSSPFFSTENFKNIPVNIMERYSIHFFIKEICKNVPTDSFSKQA